MFKLMSSGHPNCHKYGISYFVEAIETNQLLENEKLSSLAIAMRASKAEPKYFDEYIISLKPQKDVTEEEIKSNQDEFIKIFN